MQPLAQTTPIAIPRIIWRLTLPPEQRFAGLASSINSSRPPATCKRVDWKPGTVNADIGGGRFDSATEYLIGQGVKNIIYDPGNREELHNRRSIAKLQRGQADSAMCNNVLNVVQESWIRQEIIAVALDSLKPGGIAYFLMYEGDKSGRGKATHRDVWQENRPYRTYLPEVACIFGAANTFTCKGLIAAKKPALG